MSEDFSCRMPINQIRDGERVELSADEAERHSIAERLGLRSLGRLEAHAILSRDGARVKARGRLKGELEQDCVVTREAVAAFVDEPFNLLFLPQPAPGEAEEEVELSEEDCDTIFHDGAAIELGEAIADTLGLSLDPYPRSAGADAALKEAGVISEAEAGPFAALARLKKGEGA